MGKRALRKKIQSLLGRIDEHRLKIENESSKKMPDYGLIRHWETEINAFEESLDRAKKKM